MCLHKFIELEKGMITSMADFIVIAVVLVIIGAAIVYIRKEKKKGVKCIGCPAAAECAKRQNAASGCGCHTDTKA